MPKTVNPFIENSQKEWESFLETRLELINKIINENGVYKNCFTY